jgi:SAM-dependent methyltransferase
MPAISRRLDLRRFLAIPAVYSWFSAMVYPRQRVVFANEYVRARLGDRILDVGCGPADLLETLPASVDYLGFDASEAYVRSAQRRFGDRGRFACRQVDRELVAELGPASFDIVVAHGLLHHLDDRQALEFFALAHAALRPGGRLVTADGCYTESQSWLARMLLAGDRGRFVRTAEGYSKLASAHFPRVLSDIREDTFRIPYTIIFLQCTK